MHLAGIWSPETFQPTDCHQPNRPAGMVDMQLYDGKPWWRGGRRPPPPPATLGFRVFPHNPRPPPGLAKPRGLVAWPHLPRCAPGQRRESGRAPRAGPARWPRRRRRRRCRRDGLRAGGGPPGASSCARSPAGRDGQRFPRLRTKCLEAVRFGITCTIFRADNGCNVCTPVAKPHGVHFQKGTYLGGLMRT